IGLALKPMQPYAPDLCIATQDQSCGLSRELITQLDEYKSVKRAFGRMYQGNVPVSTIKDVNIIDLISYETYQFDWANAHLAEGSHEVLTVYDKSNPLTAGDKLVVTNHKGEQIELVISEVLSTSPFDNPEGIPTVICTEETFTQLTGKQEYAVIDIQLNNEITEADVTSIRNLAGANNLFSDRRESNRETVGTYWAFTILVYGFLAIIAMITVFNIINSISMSVSAKIKQYGAMRAIGMGEKQLLKMITAEALTYAISGCFTGCILGIPINQFLYKKMITNYWGNSWELPGEAIIVIFLLVFIASAAAVQIPSKRISAMTITDTINEL
ncbi:MAG: ABC transporter permease, partial [Clostridia bacterium]|nr:ABC transporter permease [Clostridia bacterium]